MPNEEAYMKTPWLLCLPICLGLVIMPEAASPAKPLDQLKSEYMDWRFGMFIHFGIETFTGDYWASKTPPAPEKFTLKAVDCKNWADGAKSAGMKFGVLTTKHHYGFCLWNTATTTYSSMHYGLKKDIVQEYVTAFRAAGLLPALYFSILDAKEGVSTSNLAYSRTMWDSKKALVLGQLRELLTNYGEIPLIVFDGWAWGSGHNNIPMQDIRELVKSLQPNCLISDHDGMTEPWDVDVLMFEEPLQVYAPVGNTHAAAQGQTINGDWFWKDDDNITSTANILDHLTKLQPRYTNFLLNCPPNQNGVLSQGILSRLADVGKSWTPMTRAALPAQVPGLEHPITAISATDNTGASAWKAIDGYNNVNSGTDISQTIWTGSGSLPQSVVLDLGFKYYNLEMLAYMPRQDQGSNGFNTSGTITGYKIYVSDDKGTYTQVASGTWVATKTLKTAQWSPAASGRYVKLEATTTSGNVSAVINDFSVGGKLNIPSTSSTGIGDKRGKRSRRALPAVSPGGTFKVISSQEVEAYRSDAAGRKNVVGPIGGK
jgi:alpha-L-fucosidase